MTDINALRELLGITDAPLVREGLTAAAAFFENTLRQDPVNWISYLRGIDFHKTVRIVVLPRGTRLVRYDSTGNRTLKPFAYYTKPGVSQSILGTNFPSVDFKEFEITRSVQALMSTASGVRFGPGDRVSRLGGGVQYIIGLQDAPALVRVGTKP